MRTFGFLAIAILVLSANSVLLSAQMNMPGGEHSAGFLSSGTSIQPKVTSEFEPMIHTNLGNWTFMFHANSFLVETQQSGPRGRDKLYSPNWMMQMLTRQFGHHSLTVRTMLSLEPLT